MLLQNFQDVKNLVPPLDRLGNNFYGSLLTQPVKFIDPGNVVMGCFEEPVQHNAAHVGFLALSKSQVLLSNLKQICLHLSTSSFLEQTVHNCLEHKSKLLS